MRRIDSGHIRRGITAGAFVLGACAALEWLVLYVKVPLALSPRLPLELVWNVLLYAAIGCVLGVLAGVLAGLLGRAGRHAPWALVMSAVLAFYWVFGVNRLYPGSSREPVALALSAGALVAGAVAAAILLRTGGGARRRIAFSALLLAVFWLPVYVLSAEPAVERMRRGSSGPPGVRAREGAPNVVLVMLDTTRADCLGCYGSEECPTPRLDAFASESALFEQCVSLQPLTRPMASTLLTGLHPRRHGVDTNTKSLDPGFDTLAETFQRAGYGTAAFTAASVLSGYYGTAQGFELYSEPSEPWWYLRSDLAVRRLYISLTQWGNWWVEIRADEVTRRASRWIRARADEDEPFFLFVHYFDPHAPYEPPESFDLALRDGVAGVPKPYEYEAQRFEDGFEMPEAYVRQEWRRYHGEIAFMDHELGRLLDAIGETGLADRTVVVVAGDHGESFGHGFYFAHEFRLYDSLVHVPLLVRWPGRVEPVRVPDQVTLSDVAPTILGLAGTPVAAESQAAPAPDGRDLSRLLLARGRPPAVDEPAYCQTSTDPGRPFYGWYSHAVRDYPWKYIESPEVDLRELYDLAADPGERTNLIEDEPERAAEMAALLEEWLGGTARFEVEPEELTPRRIEELKSLGYLQ